MTVWWRAHVLGPLSPSDARVCRIDRRLEFPAKSLTSLARTRPQRWGQFGALANAPGRGPARLPCVYAVAR